MRNMLLNICLVSLGLFGCIKDPPIKPTPYPPNPWEKKLELEEVWKTLLDEETGIETGSIRPIINRDGDIIMSNNNLRSEQEPIKLYNGKTGELKWTWKDYDGVAYNFYIDKNTTIGDALFLSAYNITYAMDMVTGQTLWKNRVNKYGSPGIYSNGDYIYKGFTGESWEYAHYLYRTKYNEANWELVYKYTDTTQTFNSLFETTVNFAKKSNGDELVIYPLEEGGSTKSPSILCCYNLTQKKVEWIVKNAIDYGSFLIGPQSIVYNGMFYSFAGLKLVAFKIEDGSIAWDREIGSPGSPGVELFLYKNNLITTARNDDPIYSINSETGDIIWSQNNYAASSQSGFDFGSSVIFKNFLISTQCDVLLFINLDNGKVIAQKQIDKGCLEYGITVNEKEGVFYVGDSKYVRCFKLPEEVLK